jgi:hypothetical protein
MARPQPTRPLREVDCRHVVADQATLGFVVKFYVLRVLARVYTSAMSTVSISQLNCTKGSINSLDCTVKPDAVSDRVVRTDLFPFLTTSAAETLLTDPFAYKLTTKGPF